jgi:hypothetical protein
MRWLTFYCVMLNDATGAAAIATDCSTAAGNDD